MKNLNVRTKVLTGLVAGGIALSLAGCSVSAQREVIKENCINTDLSGVSFKYDNGNIENPNLDYSRTNVKTFDVGEHILMLKVAGTIDYNEFVQMEVQDGYEVDSFNYFENATGEYGYSYGCFAFMLKNTEPVEVVGYYDTEKNEYIYTSFGTVIEQEKVK